MPPVPCWDAWADAAPNGWIGEVGATGYMIDFAEIADVLDEATCSALRAEIRAASGAPAALMGRPNQPAWPEVRRTRRAEVSPEIETRVTDLLAKQKAALEMQELWEWVKKTLET